MQNTETIQADLKAATDDYSDTVARLITAHAKLRGKRPGGDLAATPPATASEPKPEQPSTPGQPQPVEPAESPASSSAAANQPEKQPPPDQTEQNPEST